MFFKLFLFYYFFEWLYMLKRLKIWGNLWWYFKCYKILYFYIMKIAMATDHSGFLLKEKIKIFLLKKNYKIHDFGTYSLIPVDYPDYIHLASNAIENKEADFGVFLCGTGQGAAMTANKHPGIRAALCWSIELAKFARKHNNANVIIISAKFLSELLIFDMIDIFFSTDFDKGRHINRVNKIVY